jgi:hypothetical protein
MLTKLSLYSVNGDNIQPIVKMIIVDLETAKFWRRLYNHFPVNVEISERLLLWLLLVEF